METQKEKSLADQRVDKILAEIKALQNELKELKTTPLKVEHHEEQKKEKEPPKHFDPKDLETSCPECNKALDAWKKDLLSKTLKERAASNLVCDECGFGVEEKDESCPSCGGTHAHKRDY